MAGLRLRGAWRAWGGPRTRCREGRRPRPGTDGRGRGGGRRPRWLRWTGPRPSLRAGVLRGAPFFPHHDVAVAVPGLACRGGGDERGAGRRLARGRHGRRCGGEGPAGVRRGRRRPGGGRHRRGSGRRRAGGGDGDAASDAQGGGQDGGGSEWVAHGPQSGRAPRRAGAASRTITGTGDTEGPAPRAPAPARGTPAACAALGEGSRPRRPARTAAREADRSTRRPRMRGVRRTRGRPPARPGVSSPRCGRGRRGGVPATGDPPLVWDGMCRPAAPLFTWPTAVSRLRRIR